MLKISYLVLEHLKFWHIILHYFEVFNKHKRNQLTHFDDAKAISNQLITAGIAVNNIVYFLPIIFTINAQTMGPNIAPNANTVTTQETSSEVKCTGYSVLLPYISLGRDGDAQPINWPTDNILRFAVETVCIK